MPSPVGHSIIGLAMGTAWMVPRGSFSSIAKSIVHLRWPLAGCVALANLPDVDYVPGIISGNFNAFHHFFTHTPGWCALVAVGVWCALRVNGKASARTLGWIFALLFSHLASDIFSQDLREPCGIMALWPFDNSFFISPQSLFLSLHKDEYADFLQWHNVWAVLLECVVCLPFLAGVLLFKNRSVRVSAGSETR